MNVIKIAGILAIAGSLTFIFIPLLTPGLYRKSPEERVRYLESKRRMVIIQNIVLGLAGFLVALAFLAWSSQLGDEVPGFLWKIGAVLMILAPFFMTLFLWQTTQNPSSYHMADSISLPGNLYFIAATAAFAIYSYIFLLVVIPKWLGYLSGVVTGLMLLSFLFVGGKDLPPQPFFFISLVAGVVFLIS